MSTKRENEDAAHDSTPAKRVHLTSSNGTTQKPTASTQDAQERAVGISAYVSPNIPGFRCVVKQRYTDFLVNEILPDGHVLHLTEVASNKRRGRDDAQAKPKKGGNGVIQAIADTDGETAESGANSESVARESNGLESAPPPSKAIDLDTTSASVAKANDDEQARPKSGAGGLLEQLSGATGSGAEQPARAESSNSTSETASKKQSSRASDDEQARPRSGGQALLEQIADRSGTNGEPAATKVESNEPPAEKVAVPELAQEDRSTLEAIFGADTTTEIVALHTSILQHPDRKARDFTQVRSSVIPDKSTRTQAHVAVRRIFDSKLETTTAQDVPGSITVKCAPFVKSTRGSARKGPNNGTGEAKMNDDGSHAAQPKGKIGWSELGGEYLHFTLYKENKDTMEVLYFIASSLKIPTKNFQFAGTKDRRGVTVQKVAIFRVHSNRIAGLNAQAWGWAVGGFEYKPAGLELGDLAGNEFLLTLRDCHIDGEMDVPNGPERLQYVREKIEAAAESFRTRGFINYYGLQRFGTFTTGTHMIGVAILQGNLERAISSILSFPSHLLEDQGDDDTNPADDIRRAQAIACWKDTRNSKEAVDLMPRRFQAESSIIGYLGKKEKKSGLLIQERDWQGALMTLQRNLRLMYVHAYQSLVWNTVATRRWETFGDKVVEGDLVIVGEKPNANGDANAVADKAELDQQGEVVVHPTGEDRAPSSADHFTRARPLSAEEAASGVYDIFDVILPLPGFDVVYPPNEIGKFYEDFMGSEEGGKLNPHHMRRPWKDASLSGGYRKVMSRPETTGEGFAVEVRAYSGEEEQLVETDLEKIKKAGDGKGGKSDANGHGNDDESGKNGEREVAEQRIALILKFQLGSSQYATMALRELTKGGAANYKPDFSTTR